MPRDLWSVAVEVPKPAGALLADIFSTRGDTFTCFDSPNGRDWRFEALLEAEPDRAALEAQFALAAAAAGIPSPAVAIVRIPDRDWLAENRRQFPPVEAGRFFVHGSYFAGRPPPGRTRIVLDVGLAFGSGTHETTRGCLLAIDRLGRQRRFHRPLDLGCGSGILAIAMARLWRVPVVAADIDPVAVSVAGGNARRNYVSALVRPAVSRGAAARPLARRSGYDLIVANILARPLEKLAPVLARRLAARGILILSGLLSSQAPGVIAAYRVQGLAVARRVNLGPWTTLVLGKAEARRRASRAGPIRT